MLSYNLYAYVSNNPISNYDPTGNGKIFNKFVSGIINHIFKKKKKNQQKNIVHDVCKEKKPSGILSASYGVALNSKQTYKNTFGSVSKSYNDGGKSIDYNLFGSYGFDLSTTSADIYASSITGDTTYKNTFGIDGDYFYYGLEVKIDTGENESINAYTRVNIRKDVAIKMVETAVILIVSPPILAAGAKAIKSIGSETVEALRNAKGLKPKHN